MFFMGGGGLTHLDWERIILCFNYWKIADLQAHSAAPSAALQACRSAIFKKSWKFVFEYLCLCVYWKTYVSHLKIFSSRDPPEAKFELEMFA